MKNCQLFSMAEILLSAQRRVKLYEKVHKSDMSLYNSHSSQIKNFFSFFHNFIIFLRNRFLANIQRHCSGSSGV
jgi:hypothetical protein